MLIQLISIGKQHPKNTINQNGVEVPSENIIGNVIQNANTHNLNTTISLERFYKSLRFERFLLTKSQRKNSKKTKKSGLSQSPRKVAQNKKLPIGKKILNTW